MKFNVDQHLRKAISATRTGDLTQAERFYNEILEVFPVNKRALEGLHTLNAPVGSTSYEKGLEAVLSFYDQGCLQEALDLTVALLVEHPHQSDLHMLAGIARAGIGQPVTAIESYDVAIQLNPNNVDAHVNRSVTLMQLGRLGQALDGCDTALKLQPSSGNCHSNRGMILKRLGRLDEAAASYDNAVRVQPRTPEIHFNRANLMFEREQLAEAVAGYDAAIALRPAYAPAHNNRGNALKALNRHAEALASYEAAVLADSTSADAHANCGDALQRLGQLANSADSYARAVALNPDLADACAQLIFQQARMCDWANIGDVVELGISTSAISPFSLLALDDHAERQLLRARKWVKEKVRGAGVAFPTMPTRGPRIQIGYFSADFHHHVTMHLMARMLEQHDRSRFEVHAFSYGAHRDAMTERAMAAVDHFHDVRGMDDKAIAGFAKQQHIDIAVDLKGYTHEGRLGIFSFRPAPVQVAWLGYPGTTGAGFVDYLIADRIVLPERHQPYYSEKVVYLPDSYQVNDDHRGIADRIFSRAELGLPEDAFVFASFNGSYKIGPAEFDIWSDLLRRVEGSVLWLLRDNSWMEANLRQAAIGRGIDPDRLIFAERAPLPEHLARQRCADLFLDSFNCNAHTTGSDALWSGLPLITRSGESFASRVAASLLHAVGLPELVTETTEDYARLAVALATDSDRLAGIRQKLVANRAHAPLFDTNRLTRHIESAFELMHARHLAGQLPIHIDVPALDLVRKAA